MEFDWRTLFGRPSERESVAVVAAYMSLLALRLGIDPNRYRWSVRMVDDRWSRTRLIECSVPVHRFDSRYQVDPFRRGCMRGRPPAGLVMDPALAKRLRLRFGVFARCLAFETRLRIAGLASDPPPAVAYRTDLITRRLLEWQAVDKELVVASAPRAVRTPLWTMTSSAAESWCTAEGLPLTLRTLPGLPSDFPAMVATFQVDLLRTRAITFPSGVRVEPQRAGRAVVVIRERIPATVASALAGLRLGSVLGHPVFDDPRLVIGDVRERGETTSLIVTDPIVPLA